MSSKYLAPGANLARYEMSKCKIIQLLGGFSNAKADGTGKQSAGRESRHPMKVLEVSACLWCQNT